MRIGDDNLFEIGCRASCAVCLSPHFRVLICRFVFFFRSRIAERGQLQHGFDESARAPYCTDFVVLRRWSGLSRRADG